MNKNYYYVIVLGVGCALIVVAAFLIPVITADKAPRGPGEGMPHLESQGNQPVNGARENTTFIDIHHKDGRRILLYPEDPEYPAIEAECLEQVRCINAQIKTGFSSAELRNMKHNNTYVAINFSVPATFETSYIVDGSPKMITIDEAIFFLDSEYEDMIITPMLNGPSVWRTLCDRGEIRELIDPAFRDFSSGQS